MKIGILSRNRKLYSTKRLVEAAQARGHEVRVINHLRCYMNIASFKPSIHYNGQLLPKFDAIIPRIGASVTFYGSAVVRQFEMMGTFSLNVMTGRSGAASLAPIAPGRPKPIEAKPRSGTKPRPARRLS